MGQESAPLGQAHVPVMLDEVVLYLDPKPDSTIVDCTIGYGGHSMALLTAIGPLGRLFGIDRDRQAVSHCRKTFKLGRDRFTVLHGNYRNIRNIIGEFHIGSPDGILVDLGVNRIQLLDPKRGFSFAHEGPLDMRMDTSNPETTTARDLVHSLSEQELRTLIRDYGEESFANRIAKNIVRYREQKPIETTTELAGVVRSSIPRKTRRKSKRSSSRKGASHIGIDPATRTFQALRIAVNHELRDLEPSLNDMLSLLKVGGRLVVISFHSLEDRIVKSVFKAVEKGCICPPQSPICVCGRKPTGRILTKRVIKPNPEEVGINPSSRSAKLRAVERI